MAAVSRHFSQQNTARKPGIEYRRPNDYRYDL